MTNNYSQMSCYINFKPLGVGDDTTGPNDAVVHTFKDDFCESLVRESIQNSLDAHIEGSADPVAVTFGFGEIKREDYPELFKLKDHANGCLETWSDSRRAVDLYKPMLDQLGGDTIKTIYVKDENTRGMSDIPEVGKELSIFHVFTQSVGVSVKKTSDGGSYGFGKAAFFQMSPLRSILVSSRTPGGEMNFAGISRFCDHEIDGKKFTGKGYFSDNSDFIPTKNDNIPSDFALDEPGTCITILGQYANTWSRVEMEVEIAKSVLANFWLSIYDGKLVVRIGDHLTLDNTNVGERIRFFFGNKFTESKEYSPLPYYEAYVHSEDDSHKHVYAELEGLGKVELHLFIPENCNREEVSKFRKQLMRIQTDKKRSSSGYYALFLCKDDRGNDFLSSTEDATHKEWSHKVLADESSRKYAKSILDGIDKFINSTVDSVFRVTQTKTTIEVGLESLITPSLDQNNPFKQNAPTRSEENTDQSTKKNQDQQERTGHAGEPVRGKLSEEAKKQLTSQGGRRRPKDRIPNPDPKPTFNENNKKNRGLEIVDDKTGERYTLFHVVRASAPKSVEGDKVYQYLTIHPSEDMKNAFVHIQISAENGSLDVTVDEVSGEGVTTSDALTVKEKKADGVYILFDELKKGCTKTVKIHFEDNNAHTIIFK